VINLDSMVTFKVSWKVTLKVIYEVKVSLLMSTLFDIQIYSDSQLDLKMTLSR